MNLQIKSIVLYNKNGEKRILEFKLNSVNIITGRSKSGKSSLINIIDYCLGRSAFQISAGVISDYVDWYGILCKINDFEIFIAKPRPKTGELSQCEAYLEIENQVTIPELVDLVINSNDESITSEISNRIGISSNLNIPSEGQTRFPLEATLAHAKFLLFQPQGVIANKDVLFYRQSEPYIPQSIKDTLQYFLGIIQEDHLKLLSDLHEKKKKLRALKQGLEESEATKEVRVDRGKSLILEAQQVGLIDDNISTDSVKQIIDILTPLKDWQPMLVPPIVEDKISSKQDELIATRKIFQEISNTIKAAEMYVKDAKGFIGEATQQEIRLQSIDLYSDEDSEHNLCPVCNTPHQQLPASAEAIRKSIRTLQSEVSFVNREKPEIDDFIQKNKEKIEELRQTIKQEEFDLNTLIDEEKAATNYRDTNTRMARVVGRISYFLDVTSPELDVEIIETENKIRQCETVIKALEAEIDTKNIEDRKASVLNIIGTEMTRLAKLLELEHKDPYRLDLNKLTVVVDRPGASIIMNQNMGSAANHLGSHLIALLSLHSYFIGQIRPVPSFLVLDQPTQVYFPPEKYKNLESDIIEVNDKDDQDEDEQAVNRMFRVLFDVSKNTGLQIIILEHANLNNEDFQNAIVDGIWRGDQALIPKNWIH